MGSKLHLNNNTKNHTYRMSTYLVYPTLVNCTVSTNSSSSSSSQDDISLSNDCLRVVNNLVLPSLYDFSIEKKVLKTEADRQVKNNLNDIIGYDSNNAKI